MMESRILKLPSARFIRIKSLVQTWQRNEKTLKKIRGHDLNDKGVWRHLSLLIFLLLNVNEETDYSSAGLMRFTVLGWRTGRNNLFTYKVNQAMLWRLFGDSFQE